MEKNEETVDEFQYLEDVLKEENLNWVRERNADTQKAFEGYEKFEELRISIREVLDSKEKLPWPVTIRSGKFVYNFWEDAKYTRGVWRRTTFEEYKKKEDIVWEDLMDFAALGRAEGKSWVFSGAVVYNPGNRALLQMSDGAGDANIVREFDIEKKEFITGEKTFEFLKEAKTRISWVDENTVLIATDFGEGSLTDSGYPRIVKRWKRGQKVEDAVTLHSAEKTDVSAFGYVSRFAGGPPTIILGQNTTFYASEEYILGDEDVLKKIPKPASAESSYWGKYILLELRKDWNAWKAGSLLIGEWALLLSNKDEANPPLEVLFAPTSTCFLQYFTTTRTCIIVNTLDNVVSKLEEYRLKDGKWTSRAIDAPSPGTLGVSSMKDSYLKDDPLGESYFVTYRGFLSPTTLYQYSTETEERILVKSMKPFFDSTGMRAEQFHATSKDGTKIPYFVVFPAQKKEIYNTLLYGYGGFEISETPFYSGTFGRSWLSNGGVFVLANIRGGGEFGPRWHQQGLKSLRQNCFDDFIAVAEDLISRKITDSEHLGIEGGSNGGLLVMAVAVQRPELFKAVVCQCPLLDMKRYSKLLAGNSWMEEYGDPDTTDWEFMKKWSPYHNIKNVKHPNILFTTSTRDDRVHPGHARKTLAKMRKLGIENCYLYENTEGGHANAADNTQRAFMSALEFSFLLSSMDK